MFGSLRFFLSAACIAQALIAPVAAADSPAGPFTEPRNAATGFAVTVWMAMDDTLGKHCGTLDGDAGQQARDALARWQGHNQKLVETAFTYMVALEGTIEASNGEAARRAFRNARQQEFMAAARQMQTTWFPEAQVDAERCLRLARQVSDGGYDIARTPEFHDTLQAMAAGR